jgi:DUF4097 and DUF4098 domain-containing protein YvlB
VTGIYLAGDTQGALPTQTSSGDVDAFVLKLCETYSGNVSGDLKIASGRVCINGATVAGNVTLTGGSLTVMNSTIQGNLTVQSGNAALSILAGTVITNNLVGQNLPAARRKT